MRLLTKLILLSTLTFFLSGCWDEQLLKDVALINSQSFDVDSRQGVVKMSVAIVSGNANEKIPTKSVLMEADGTSVRDARTELDKKIGSELFASKNQITLISKKLAEQDIYAVLDGNYRSPLSALMARLAIVEGEAGEALHVQTENRPLVSDYLENVLTSAEDIGSIPRVTLQTTLTVLYDDGEDLLLPTIQILKNKSGIMVSGAALFNGRELSGTLNSDETIMLLLLEGNKKGTHRMTRKVNAMKDPLYNYITVDVVKMKRRFNMTPNDQGSYDLNIDLVLKLDANEYPSDHLYKAGTVKRLNTELSEMFTKEANEVLNKLKEANCDYLGLGRHAQAYYYDTWKNQNWKDTYPTINMKANVTTEIIYHGIIN